MKLTEKEIINRVCDICGSGSNQLITIANGYPISKCSYCNFVYVNKIPPVKDGKVVGEYYQEVTNKIGSEPTNFLEICVSDPAKNYTKVTSFLLTEFARRKPLGKLLDIGCGLGSLLVAARDKGWEVYGTELSEMAVKYIKKTHLIKNVECSELTDVVFPDVKFDVINLTNVLEHVPSPTETLRSCHDRLETSGIVVIRVPNITFHKIYFNLVNILKLAGIAKGITPSYLATDPPIHLCGFSDSTLRHLFSKCGLQTLEIKPSKLSSTVNKKFLFRVIEIFSVLLYRLSFQKINISPTILAIAVQKNRR